jgi:hypothetical protein
MSAASPLAHPASESFTSVQTVINQGIQAHMAPSSDDDSSGRGSGRLQLVKPLASTANHSRRSKNKPPSDAGSVKLIAIGSRQALLNNMKTLHTLRYADIGDWSKLQRGPNPGEFMAVLTVRSPRLWTS